MSWKESILEIFEASDAIDFEDLYIENLKWSTKHKRSRHLNGYKLHTGHAVKKSNKETTNYPLKTQKQARMLLEELRKKDFSVEVLSGKVNEDVYNFWQWMHIKGRPWVGVKLMKKANAVVESMLDGVAEVPGVEKFKQIHFVDKKPQVLKIKRTLKNNTELEETKNGRKTKENIIEENNNKDKFEQPKNGFPISNLSCSPNKNMKKTMSQENNILLTTIVAPPTPLTLDIPNEESTKLEKKTKHKTNTLNGAPTKTENFTNTNHTNTHKTNGPINGVVTNEKNDCIKVNLKALKMKPFGINTYTSDETVLKCNKAYVITKDSAKKQCETHKTTYGNNNNNIIKKIDINNKNHIYFNKINNNNNKDNNNENSENFKNLNDSYEDSGYILNKHKSNYSEFNKNINDNNNNNNNNNNNENGQINQQPTSQTYKNNKNPTSLATNNKCSPTKQSADRTVSEPNRNMKDKNGIVKINNKALESDTKYETVKSLFNDTCGGSFNRGSRIDHLIKQFNDKDTGNFKRGSVLYSSLRTDSPFKRFSKGNVSERYTTPLKIRSVNTKLDNKTCQSPLETPPTYLSNSLNIDTIKENLQLRNLATSTPPAPTNGVKCLFEQMQHIESPIQLNHLTPSFHPPASPPTHVEKKFTDDSNDENKEITKKEIPLEIKHNEVKNYYNETYICISKRDRTTLENTHEKTPRSIYKNPPCPINTSSKISNFNNHCFTLLVQKSPSTIDNNYKYQPKASRSNSVKNIIKKFNEFASNNEVTRSPLKTKPFY